jgi:hypothetical protein
MKKILLLMCCSVLLLTSCTTTKVLSTWEEDSHADKYNTIFVLGLVNTPVYRALLERQLVNFFKDAGVEAHTTYDIFPDWGSLDKATAAAVIRDKGGDGVMVVRLIDKKEETRYLRGKTYVTGGYMVRDSSGDWYGYYEKFGTSDIIIDQHISLVESIFFDVDKGKRVWSAMTRTSQTSASDSIHSYRKAIGRQLASSGLF